MENVNANRDAVRVNPKKVAPPVHRDKQAQLDPRKIRREHVQDRKLRPDGTR